MTLQDARIALSRWAARRATRLEVRQPRAAERWLRLAGWLAPRFDFVHRDLYAHYRRVDDRLAALAAAQAAQRRFNGSAEAWLLLAEAFTGAYRHREALAAYEAALALEERADAAQAAGELHLKLGDPVSAAACFARAYAAGGAPGALRANAEALQAAGDDRAAQEAQRLWETRTGRKWETRDEGRGTARS